MPGRFPALPEGGEVGGVVLREAPRPRALCEELDRVGADLDRPVERPLDASRAVGAGDHGFARSWAARSRQYSTSGTCRSNPTAS